jgi:hypothetical protein
MLRFPAILGLLTALTAASPPPVTIHATQPGLQTRDSASDGGNPFASAFIELLARPELDLPAFAGELAARTERLSDGFQRPDLPVDIGGSNVRPGRAARGERRVALVLVLSDYRFGLASLPGAQHDAIRVAEALRRAGFDTRLVLDPEREQVEPILAGFAAQSAEADIALIYTTGHGIEVDGVGYLLNRDFPALLGHHGLATYAVPLARIAGSAQARTANLLFYAGCRDDPFGS